MTREDTGKTAPDQHSRAERPTNALLGEVAGLGQPQEPLVEQLAALQRLNRFAIELSLLPSEADLEAFVVDQLIDISGGIGAVFTEYDPASRNTTVKRVQVEPRMLERIVHLLGRQLVGFKAFMDEETYEAVTTNVVKLRKTLYEGSFGSMPRPVAAAVQALLGADRFIGVGYMVEGSLYGTSLLAIGKGRPVPSLEILKSFSFLVALALRRRRAEVALRESEERHRLLADHASDVIWTMDIDGHFTYISPSIERLRGYTPVEAMQQSLSETLTPASAAVAMGVLAKAAEAVRAGRPATDFRGELEQPCKDGTTVWTDHRVTELRDDSGEFIGFLGVTRDITERKRAEADQRTSREILQILSGPGALSTLVERVLATIRAGTGFDAAGIRLQSGEDYPYIAQDNFPEGFVDAESVLIARDSLGVACPNADGTPSLDCTCGLVISGGGDPANAIFTKGGSFWTNDAQSLLDLAPADDPRRHPRNRCVHSGYLSIALVPIRNKERIVGLIHLADKRKGRLTLEAVERLEGIAAQIGEALVRKQAEAALLESQQRYEALVNLSPDAIVVDAGGVYVFANPAAARLFGAQSPQELVGERVLERIHPDFREFIARRAEQVASGSVAPAREIKILRMNGGAVDVEATAARIEFDGRGANQVVLRDITDRKRAETRNQELERQLQESQKLESLGVLAGGIAHDFNNMLTAILGFSDIILASDLSSPDVVLSDVAEIRQAAERAKALTGAILAFSRRQPREPKTLALGSLVSELEPLLRRTIGENIDLVCNLSAEAPLVEIDPGQFTQVVVNLVLNARDAMPVGGTLTLQVAGRHAFEIAGRTPQADGASEWAMLSVSDTGVGMDPGIVSRIFEPFFTTKGPGEGTGLGLSIAYGVVKQSGGDIVVRSIPGEGSVVEVYLPGVEVAAEAGEGPGDGAAAKARRTGSPRMIGETVLLVEDEPAVRRLAGRILKDYGYTVLVAADGQRALSLALDRSISIDALLTDMVLPGALQGDELARLVLRERPTIKVVYMSGYPRDAMEQSGRLQLGDGTTYLDKPFTAESLAAKLREALDRGGR